MKTNNYEQQEMRSINRLCRRMGSDKVLNGGKPTLKVVLQTKREARKLTRLIQKLV